MLAHRPITDRYIRIDEMAAPKRSNTAISITARVRVKCARISPTGQLPLHGQPRRDRQEIPLNYYFLSQALASKLMADDNQNHLVSQVTAGQIESSDVQVQNVTITSISEEMIQGARMARARPDDH